MAELPWTETFVAVTPPPPVPGLQLSLLGDPGLVDLRLPRDRELRSELAELLGADLAVGPGGSAETERVAVLWVGRSRRLLLSDRDDAAPLAALIATRLQESGLVIDVTGAKAAILVEGERAPELSAHLGGPDLAGLQPGSAAVARLGGLEAILFQPRRSAGRWTLLVDRSLAIDLLARIERSLGAMRRRPTAAENQADPDRRGR